MSYYEMLNFRLEPFSNTPDPDFFFETRQHLACLQKIELSVRLRRGLVVVLGEVGTGKTTLCRQIIRRLHRSDEIETHLVLDPEVNTPLEFLRLVAAMITGQLAPDDTDVWQLKEIIKNCLFRKGIDEGRVVVLMVDEGQKIPSFCLELLREFLNYETNEHKLLQIVIFAQKELKDKLQEHQNFADRVNLYHILEPLDFKDTRMMILHRLNRCSTEITASNIFTLGAFWMIYRTTGGYPRKIINLCHLCLMALIIKNQARVDAWLVRASSKRLPLPKQRPVWRRYPAILTGISLLAVLVVLGYKPVLQAWKPYEANNPALAAPSSFAEVESTPAAAGEKLHKTVSQNVTEPATSDASSIKDGAEVFAAVGVGTTPTGSDTEKAIPKVVEAEPPREGVLDVSIRAGESLYWMTAKVYGTTAPKILDLVCRANENLGDFHRIAVGKTIRLPLIPMMVDSEVKEYFYVQLLNTNSLESAFEAVRALQPVLPQARIIPYWTPRENIRFAVIVPPVCTEESRARRIITELPESVAARSELASFTGEDYFYFADLFTVN